MNYPYIYKCMALPVSHSLTIAKCKYLIQARILRFGTKDSSPATKIILFATESIV